jgi:predicted Zn finger-like uncharacterized protein
MEISCEECGRRYRVDETRIMVKTGKFKCRACNNILVITKPEPIEETEPIELYEE